MPSLRVTGSAASVIETDVIEAFDDYYDAEVAPIYRAWRKGSLVYYDSEASDLRRALIELSNRCDDLSHEPSLSPDERKVYAKASSALVTLFRKIEAH